MAVRLAAIILLLMGFGRVAAQEPANWSGEWRSFWRDGQALMTLEQLGDRVVGGYRPGPGRIEGRVEGERLVGTWTEEAAGGAFEFAISPDRRSFAGRFGNGEYWNGVRLAKGLVSPTPFTRSDTPRETLRTVVTAANATAEGQAVANLIWEPLLRYAPDSGESSRELTRRRLLLNRLMDMMTFRVHEAPEHGEGGEATFDVGPAGAAWTTTLRFVEDPPGRWNLLVPPLAAIEADIAGALAALGYDDYGAYLIGRAHHPRQVMRDFLNGVATWDEGGAQQALSTLDMSDITPQLHAIEGPLAADFLRQIIDRIGYVIWQEIPDNPDQVGPYVHYAHAAGDIAIAPQRLEDGTALWRFTPQTLRAAPAIYEAIRSLPVAEGLAEPRPFSDYFRLRDRVKAVSPALLERRWLLETWQWLALGGALAAFAALAALLGLAWRGASRLATTAAGAGADVADALRDGPVWPLRLIAFGAGLRAVIGELGLRRDFLEALGLVGALALTLGLALLAYRLAAMIGGYFIRRAERSVSYVDDIVASLITGLVKVVVVVGAIVALAEVVGLPYEGVIAGLGVGGLALAIAARDTVSNFFGAAILMADRPFKRGDVVEIGGQFAIVEGMGLRSTRLRTFEDSLLLIPNGKLADQTINNLGRRRQRRIQLKIGVTYDTPRDKLDAFIDALRETFLAQPRAMASPVFVGLTGFGDSAIEIELIGNLRTADHGLFIEAQHRLVADIISCAERLGVSFAFPTRTIHVPRELTTALAGVAGQEAA